MIIASFSLPTMDVDAAGLSAASLASSDADGSGPLSASGQIGSPRTGGFDPVATRDTIQKLLQATDRPVLLVGPEAERSAALAALATALSSQVMNLGSELASALMSSETRFDIAARIAGLSAGSEPLLLDHIEILLLPQLKIDLLDTLIRASRRRPICVAWPGRLENGRLRYANYNHPESFDEDAARVIVHDLSTHEGANA